MTPADHVARLTRWHHLARLAIGRNGSDARRIEQLETEIAAALEEAKREAAVDPHVAREMGGGA